MSDTHKILTDLENSGELKHLVNSGFCPPSVYRDLEVYRFVDARLKTGSGKNSAVLDAEIQFKFCRKTVFNILKRFR